MTLSAKVAELRERLEAEFLDGVLHDGRCDEFIKPLLAIARDALALLSEREADAERVFAEFERRTKALPYQHEVKEHGCCSYNWRAAHLTELRAIAALAEKGPRQ